jgi:hypothetical protein
MERENSKTLNYQFNVAQVGKESQICRTRLFKAEAKSFQGHTLMQSAVRGE